MRTLRAALVRVLALFRRRRIERDLDDELAFHLAMKEDVQRQSGLSSEEARRIARWEFGNVGVIRDRIRTEWQFAWIEAVLQDVRLAVRGLRRDGRFTALATLTLALGICVNVVAFSVLDAVLVRPLPYDAPDRLVTLGYGSPGQRVDPHVPSTATDAWRRAHSFEALETFTSSDAIVAFNGGEQIQAPAVYVSDGFLPLLGGPARVVLGRWFAEDDRRPDADQVVLLSHPFWVSRLGGDPGVLGTDLRIGGRLHVVIGILSPAFRFPGNAAPDLILRTRHFPPGVVTFSNVIARLSPAATVASAQRELVGIDRSLERTGPIDSKIDHDSAPRVIPLQTHLAGDLAPLLRLAVLAAVLVLVLACANVAGLLLSRSIGRSTELAMRAAMGATTFRLVQLVVTETFVLSIAGAGLGAVAGVLVLPAIQRLLSEAHQTVAVRMDAVAAGMTGVLTLLTIVLCASLPVLRAVRLVSRGSLRSTSPGSIRRARPESVRRILVGGQIAAALTILCSAGLLLGTFWRLQTDNLGFQSENLSTFQLSIVGADASASQRRQLTSDLLEGLARAPGIVAAGATTTLPLAGQFVEFTIPVAGEPAPAPDAVTAVDLVTPGYFATIGAPIVSGRDFDWRDGAESPRVAIVNERFVRERLPAGDPLLRHISLGGGPEQATIQIVGVVGDVANHGPGEQTDPHVYRPFTQAAPQIGWGLLRVAVRTAGVPFPLENLARRNVSVIAPQAAVYGFSTMADRMAGMVAPERQRALVLGVLAGGAVLLAVVGLYSLLSSFVAGSLPELALRAALGASQRRIHAFVIQRSVVPVAGGIVLGLTGAIAATPLLRGFLYGVTPSDPAVLVICAASLIVVAVVASYIPARRASKVNPVSALKCE